MKNHVKRLTALLLCLCMLMAVIPTAAAAGTISASVKSELETLAIEYGFERAYNGEVQFVQARGEGRAVTAKLDYTEGASNRTTAVIVQAVDESGNAISGKPARVVLGEERGNQVYVTYQETDCEYFAMMPVQGVLDQGSIDPLTTTCDDNGSTYSVRVNAQLVMSDALALIAAYNKDHSKMEDFRFTCYLENDILADMSGLDEEDFSFSDPRGVYTLVDVRMTAYGLAIEYRLSDETLENLFSEKIEDVVNALQTRVSMRATRAVSARELERAANVDDEIYTYGRIEITCGRMIPGVDVESILVPAKLAVMELDEDYDFDDDDGERIPIADPNKTGVADWLNVRDHMAFMQGDDQGMFRPNENITRAEVCAIFYRLLLDQNVKQKVEFSDVADTAWYAVAVNSLASLGIVRGFPDGTFKPNQAITRAEFAAVCARFADAADGRVRFLDVRKSDWFYDEVATAAAYGWITGVGGGMFAPHRAITRAEAATLVNRMLGRLPDESAINHGDGRQFPDVTRAHWAWYQIGEATTDHYYRFNSYRTQEDWGATNVLPQMP